MGPLQAWLSLLDSLKNHLSPKHELEAHFGLSKNGVCTFIWNNDDNPLDLGVPHYRTNLVHPDTHFLCQSLFPCLRKSCMRQDWNLMSQCIYSAGISCNMLKGFQRFLCCPRASANSKARSTESGTQLNLCPDQALAYSVVGISTLYWP